MHLRHAIVWAVAVLGGCGGRSDKSATPPSATVTQPELSWRTSDQRSEGLPISLTASDGSGLELVSIEARAVIEDPLAFTELHLRFRNPEPRRREGRFQISLPPTAAVSRFAMRIGGTFQEGELVERRRAQQVYEDYLHRKQDPALLEKAAGNEFSARVFPIEPNSVQELIVSYSEELERRDTPYKLLVLGLPQVQELSVFVQVGSSGSAPGRAQDVQLQLREHDFVPSADLQVRLPWQKPLALRNGELVVARVAPVLDVPASNVPGLTVLFDSSASRALGFGAQIERLAGLLAGLEKRTGQALPLRVIAFDQGTEEVYRGPASGFDLRAQSKLLARDALGASDLGQALTFLAEHPDGHARVLVIGDGVITAGIEDTTSLREAVARLGAHGVRRVDVLAEGGIQDRDTLAVLTRGGLAETGVVMDATAPLAELVDRMLKGTRARVEVHIAGAEWVYPSVLEGLQPGDERLVFAELPAANPVQIELLGAGAEAHDTLEVPRPLLERAWARAKIEAMTLERRALGPDDGRAGRLERDIIELSLSRRVVSDYTAWLVLEGPAEYARFGLEQRALTDIVRVGQHGLELWNRQGPSLVQIAAADDVPVSRRAQGSLGNAQPAGSQLGCGSQTPGVVTGRRPEPTATSSAPSPAEGQLPLQAARPRFEAEEQHDKAAEPPPPAAEMAKRSSARSSDDGFAAAPEEKAKGDSRALEREANAPGGFAAAAPRKAAPAPEPAAISGMGSGAGANRQGRRDESSAAPASKVAAERSASGGLGDLLGSAAPADESGRARLAQPWALAPVTTTKLRAAARLRSAAGLPSAETSRALRSLAAGRAAECFASTARAGQRLEFELSIDDKGSVSSADARDGAWADRNELNCFLSRARAARFPKPDGGRALVTAELAWSEQVVSASPPPVAAGPRKPRPVRIPSPTIEDAYSGALAEVLQALARNQNAAALARASAAHAESPTDVLGLIALGEALEAGGDHARAARAYGSLIDLFPARADLRRMAGARLERLQNAGLALAVDSYRRAVAQRPDHPSGQRLLAYALLKQSDRAQAFETLERALDRGYDTRRFEGVERILREDLALVGAAWVRVDPSADSRVRAALESRAIPAARTPSTRFVLNWETDANDVDFHIYDGRGGHAYYMQRRLASGGALYADITTGYGPECFAIPTKAAAYPYVLQAHYFARGPMGYGMGKLEVIEHDGKGGLSFAEHPFVIMKDKAFVELARVDGPQRASEMPAPLRLAAPDEY